MRNGRLIVLDGGDGTGKSTQVDLLVQALNQQGQEVEKLDFPRYGQPSAWYVEQYLTGKFGELKEIGPYQGSVFYALDRYAIKQEIEKMLVKGKVLIANRYVSASMGHQGAKIKDKKSRYKYYDWLYDFEYKKLGIPRPDATIILHMPAEITQTLVDKKGHRDYVGGNKRDLHEADLDHLKIAEQVFREIANEFSNFHLIECYEKGHLLTREKIHDKVLAIVHKNNIL